MVYHHPDRSCDLKHSDHGDIIFLNYTSCEHMFKVGLPTSKKICVICLIESPLKMMKNALMKNVP